MQCTDIIYIDCHCSLIHATKISQDNPNDPNYDLWDNVLLPAHLIDLIWKFLDDLRRLEVIFCRVRVILVSGHFYQH